MRDPAVEIGEVAGHLEKLCKLSPECCSSSAWVSGMGEDMLGEVTVNICCGKRLLVRAR